MNVFDKGFFTILGCSALFILVALPLALRKVPRNRVYGFRTRATLADDAVWFAANAHFGRGLVISSLCSSVIAFVLFVLQPFPPEVFLPVSLLAIVAPNLLAAVVTWRYVRSLAVNG
jgi:uncharacterized membrane protein